MVRGVKRDQSQPGGTDGRVEPELRVEDHGGAVLEAHGALDARMLRDEPETYGLFTLLGFCGQWRWSCRGWARMWRLGCGRVYWTRGGWESGDR